MSKVYYNRRIWLNSENSRSTGSVVCFDGKTEFSDGADRDSFIEIADCHGKVRLHKSSDDSVTEFIQKLSMLRNEVDSYINHLKTKVINEGIYNQLNTRYMKNLFKMYRDWKNRKFVEKINKVYFKQDNAGNLFMEGSLHVYGKNNGIITSWMDKSKEDVKNSLAHRLS